MQGMNLFHKILILLFGVAISVSFLNYAGQVAVNGEAFDGNGLFKFALVNADGIGAMTERSINNGFQQLSPGSVKPNLGF